MRNRWLWVVALLLCIAAMGNCMAETDSMPAEAEAQSIGLTGVGNARELGGYVAEDGRAVRRGVFLRTAALGNATEADIKRLVDDYHLSLVIDLRMTSEIEQAPDPVMDGVENLHLGIIDEAALAAKRQSLSAEDVAGLDMNSKLGRLRMAMKLGIVGDHMYIDFLSGEPGKAGYARMFRELLALPEGEAMLFHCTQGKDRTGCAAMLILSALGVDEETIMADFMLTNTFNAHLIEAQRQMLIDEGMEGDELETFMYAMDKVNPQFMQSALDWMRENYGSALDYIRTELHVTDDEIATLRDRYLESEIEYANAA